MTTDGKYKYFYDHKLRNLFSGTTQGKTSKTYESQFFGVSYQWKESDDAVLLVADDVGWEFLFCRICIRQEDCAWLVVLTPTTPSPERLTAPVPTRHWSIVITNIHGTTSRQQVRGAKLMMKSRLTEMRQRKATK